MTSTSIGIIVPSISIGRSLTIPRGLVEVPATDTIRLEENVSILSSNSLII